MMSRLKRNTIIDIKKKWVISLLVPLAILSQGLLKSHANESSFNPTDYVDSEYGNPDGLQSLYYKFDENNKLQKVNNVGNANFTVKYAPNYYNVGSIININGNEESDLTEINNKYYRYCGERCITINNSHINSIIADFVNNNKGTIYGGGTIDTISANFIENNYSYSYPVILNSGTIGDITGDFIHNINADSNSYLIKNSGRINTVSGNFIGNGSILYNENSGRIDNISGLFMDNNLSEIVDFSSSINNKAKAEGSVIYNNNWDSNHYYGNIKNIIGNFIGNSIYAEGPLGYANGGVIYNVGNIENINGEFVGNSATAISTNGYSGAYSNGGAIYNEHDIGEIQGNFIGNNASVSGDYMKAFGGAIYNTNSGTIDNITNSSFYDNYAEAISNTSSGESYQTIARGGAIYTLNDLTITADNGTSTFKGNYTNNNGQIDDNAISIGDNSNHDKLTLTLKTVNNGEIYLYDNIDTHIPGNDPAKYNVHITGDNSGIVHIYNDIRQANITTDNVTIDFVNNNIHNYDFGNLQSSANTKYNIDIDLTGNGSADTITRKIAQWDDEYNDKSIITLNDVNIMNSNSEAKDDYKIKVLNNANNDFMQLALSDDLANKEIVLRNTESHDVEDEVPNAVKWDDKFEKYTLNTSVVGNVTLDTTTTTNDSIKLTATSTQTTKTDNVSLGDTLALVNQLDTAEDRSFTFDTANDKYNASSDLGTTTAGKLSINGVSATTEGTTSRSEINLNGHNGFELDNETTLNINDTRLTGNDTLITVNNQNAVVNLQNADLNGSIAAENSYSLSITGDTSDRTIINGGVGKANATHSGGELGFNTDTFKDAEFSTVGGTVDLVTGQVENYDIGKLTSNESANWIFEIDSSGSSADTLTVGTGSSGTVNVSEINFINGDSPSNEFTVQVLNAEDDNIQLAIDSSISGENHRLGTVTKTSQDTVTPTVKWNQTFNKYTQNGTNYGNIDVATTNTTNDSLQLQVTSTEWDEAVVSGSMGDTLALVNQLETEETRNFNFDTSGDVYNVKSDLGTTSAGVMNVNGVAVGSKRSTINGNNYNMFVLSNPTTLNLNNVKVTGANSVVSGTNKNAVINMKNVELSNNASGITTAGSVNISGKSLFKNNGNGIEVTSDDSIITLNGIDGEGYDVTFNDKLKGVSGAKLNLKAGQVEFHKSVTDLDINMEGTTANLKADNVFNGQNLTVASASNINMINNSVGTMQLNSLTLNDNMNLGVDVDLANKSMDRISANTYNLGEHKVNVNKMNLLSDAKEVRTDIEFADENLRNNVTTSVSEVAYSPIYKYGVKYDQDNGEFQFTRSNSGGGGGDNPQPQPSYNDLNPAIMASPVAAQLGGYAGMLDNYSNAFNHMDMYMLKPANLRAAELNANKYAIADGTSARYYSNETNTNGVWIRPYTSYDSVGLKHGPKVRNVSYGSFIGGDFGMHNFGNGLYGAFSPYISYQGAHQRYSGNSVYQNGGTLGFTGTLYKGNFFTGLTAGVGANVTEASTMYGNEDFPMLTTGVASKTGYNIEFKDGKFIIQPNLLVSYTFVNTFDYTNAAGVRIDTAPLHAVQINPNIRFVLNTKNYWQPYAFVGMNWNIMESGHFKAADTTLPELSVKPYVQYGLGIQKLFSDNFTAFAQIAIRNGGRNGVGGTFGMKWIFGGQPQNQQQIKQKNAL